MSSIPKTSICSPNSFWKLPTLNPGKTFTEKDKGTELKGIGPKINNFISRTKSSVVDKQQKNKSKVQHIPKENQNDSTYNSHQNQSQFPDKKPRSDKEDLTSESEFENESSFNDGPLSLAPNPNQKYLSNKIPQSEKIFSVPQRSWEPDYQQNIVTNSNQNQNQNQAIGNTIYPFITTITQLRDIITTTIITIVITNQTV